MTKISVLEISGLEVSGLEISALEVSATEVPRAEQKNHALECEAGADDPPHRSLGHLLIDRGLELALGHELRSEKSALAPRIDQLIQQLFDPKNAL